MWFNFKDIINFHLGRWFHIKDLHNNVKGHIKIIHTRLKSFMILTQDFIYTFYVYQIRDTSLPKQYIHILHIRYSISFKKHIGITNVID